MKRYEFGRLFHRATIAGGADLPRKCSVIHKNISRSGKRRFQHSVNKIGAICIIITFIIRTVELCSKR